EKLINEFSLVKVDYAYNPILSTKPVKDIYKSTNDAYAKLVVVDKENGKSKADASNAGINVCNYPYFVCTDVDCILHEAVLQKLIKPIMEDDKFRVIATGATLRLSNSCEVDGGVITKIRAPKGLISCFQELEYIRAFVLGKMGWSYINAVPNVSGGLGMFDKEIAIKSGGYDPLSFGEDMELLMRMNRYVHENKIISAVKYVPVTLCWTEGPSTLKVFMRQRTRWARGLFQLMVVHRNVFFNPKYGKLGMIVYPYSFFFELIAPIIEFTGVLYYIYIIITNQINWGYAVILLIFVYTYSVMISTIAVLWDQITFKYYKVPSDVLRLCLMVFVEMLLYHPLIVIFSLRGYFFYLTNQKHVWGAMTRKGFQKSQSASATPATA
ncbi:MAG: glycosyltransferase family 2 protein, partial [Chitinophagia bacterium]|nr:glycosyltransferase family 2 protein [Chitinophagia bacterium]